MIIARVNIDCRQNVFMGVLMALMAQRLTHELKIDMGTRANDLARVRGSPTLVRPPFSNVFASRFRVEFGVFFLFIFAMLVSV